MIEAALNAGKVLREAVFQDSGNQGVTGVVMIAESLLLV